MKNKKDKISTHIHIIREYIPTGLSYETLITAFDVSWDDLIRRLRNH